MTWLRKRPNLLLFAPTDFKFSSARHEAISNRTVSLARFQNDVLKLSLADVKESGK